jgi:hypothetical protein
MQTRPQSDESSDESLQSLSEHPKCRRSVSTASRKKNPYRKYLREELRRREHIDDAHLDA